MFMTVRFIEALRPRRKPTPRIRKLTPLSCKPGWLADDAILPEWLLDYLYCDKLGHDMNPIECENLIKITMSSSLVARNVSSSIVMGLNRFNNP
jgi:hypothetical protein